MEKETAFKKLYDEHRDRIYRMCCYYVSSEEDRKDLYQEVFFNLWKGLEKFRGDSALSTWAYRVTVNSALSYLARTKSRKKKSSAYHQFILTQGQPGRQNSGEGAIDLLHAAIVKLPLIDMIIVSLVLEEASTREIARTTGLTESNVRVRIHRAKHRLRLLIEGEKS